MSPFAVLWIAVDVGALVLITAAVTRREQRTAFELRPLLPAQMVVVASAIAALTAIEPLRTYAEWTLMVAVNLGYALTSWRDGAAARSLATMAIVATTIAVALITLKSFGSIVVIAIGLVFAIGALFATLLPIQARARA